MSVDVIDRRRLTESLTSYGLREIAKSETPTVALRMWTALIDYIEAFPPGTPVLNCEDCQMMTFDLIRKTDHHGGTKVVCEDRAACHVRSPG